jgi:hypothetical protein
MLARPMKKNLSSQAFCNRFSRAASMLSGATYAIVKRARGLPFRVTLMNVAKWLRDLGLEQYAPAFRDNA